MWAEQEEIGGVAMRVAAVACALILSTGNAFAQVDLGVAPLGPRPGTVIAEKVSAEKTRPFYAEFEPIRLERFPDVEFTLSTSWRNDSLLVLLHATTNGLPRSASVTLVFLDRQGFQLWAARISLRSMQTDPNDPNALVYRSQPSSSWALSLTDYEDVASWSLSPWP